MKLDKTIIIIGSLVKVDEYDHLIEVDGFLCEYGKLYNTTEVCLVDNHSYSFDEVEEVWNKVDDETYKRQYTKE
jgi:archaellum biogenesis ATPase FlaH